MFCIPHVSFYGIILVISCSYWTWNRIFQFKFYWKLFQVHLMIILLAVDVMDYVIEETHELVTHGGPVQAIHFIL